MTEVRRTEKVSPGGDPRSLTHAARLLRQLKGRSTPNFVLSTITSEKESWQVSDWPCLCLDIVSADGNSRRTMACRRADDGRATSVTINKISYQRWRLTQKPNTDHSPTDSLLDGQVLYTQLQVMEQYARHCVRNTV